MREEGKEEREGQERAGQEKRKEKGMHHCIPLHKNDLFNLGKL